MKVLFYLAVFEAAAPSVSVGRWGARAMPTGFRLDVRPGPASGGVPLIVAGSVTVALTALAFTDYFRGVNASGPSA